MKDVRPGGAEGSEDPALTHGSLRLAAGVAALAALWVAVYWWAPGGPERTIAFQPPPEDPSPAPITFAPVEPAARPNPVEAPEPTRPSSGVEPPSFFQHTVARGDSAQSISKKYYGTEAHWRAVMHANPKTDFQHLRKGLVVRVPVDPKNVQGKPATAAETPKASSPTDAEVARGFEYVVEKGDTLSGLAFRFYGKASRWPAIAEANRELMGEDGSKFRAGMTIIIPPSPDDQSR
jgi:nucleoid-associated protein YgaU